MKKLIFILLIIFHFYSPVNYGIETGEKQQEETKFNIGMLPNEVLESIILDLLDAKTAHDAVDNLLAFASTNKQFYQLINQNPYLVKTILETFRQKYSASNIINSLIVSNLPGIHNYLQNNLEVLTNLIEKLIKEENNLNTIIDSLAALSSTNYILYSLINSSDIINLIFDQLQAKHQMHPLYYSLLLSQLEGTKNYIKHNKEKFQPLQRSLSWSVDPFGFAKNFQFANWKFDPDLTIQLAMLKMLIDLDVNINQTIAGYTPLMLAIEENQEVIVAYLLTVPNIDLEKINPKGKTALGIAKKIGNENIIKMLEKVLGKKE
ncbi:MAG: ankyrin repeat domain-containing protein [Candidatus Babeliales bacterium]